MKKTNFSFYIDTYFLKTFFSNRARGVSSSFFKLVKLESLFFFFLLPFSGIVRSTPVSRYTNKQMFTNKLLIKTTEKYYTWMSLSSCGSCQSGLLGCITFFDKISFSGLITRPSSSLDTISPWNGHYISKKIEFRP